MLISPAVTARSLVKTSKDAGTRELDVFAMARAAGLDTAADQFPQDVAAAAQSAAADPYIRSDKLRALAVRSEKRNPSLPNVPTMSEALPGFVVTSWWAIVAPPGTPATIANSLSSAIAESLKQPDLARRLVDLSMVATGSTPAELGLFIEKEGKRWGDVIRAAGVQAQ